MFTCQGLTSRCWECRQSPWVTFDCPSNTHLHSFDVRLVCPPPFYFIDLNPRTFVHTLSCTVINAHLYCGLKEHRSLSLKLQHVTTRFVSGILLTLKILLLFLSLSFFIFIFGFGGAAFLTLGLFSAKDVWMEARMVLSLMLWLPSRSSVVRAVLVFRTSAIAAAPTSDTTLRLRCNVVSAVLVLRASASATAPASDILLR